MGQEPLFRTLSTEQKAELAALFTPLDLRSGQGLFTQGEVRRGLYLVLQGAILIFDTDGASGDKERILLEAGPGNIIGEAILMEEEFHSVNARAGEASRLGILPLNVIEELRENSPKIFAALLTGLSRSLARRVAYDDQSRGRQKEFQSGKTRREHDLIGDRDIPANVLWGVQTDRAMENFQISGVPLAHFPDFIESLAYIKHACALANQAGGQLDEKIAAVIIAACREIEQGRFRHQFQVDMIQGGAGTSTNMNANEVIANRALRLLGEEPGAYNIIHPNNHVNMSQSTNDVYPSAIKIALLRMAGDLIDEIDRLAGSLLSRGQEFNQVIKMGRTQLQDAVPMTLGQEFTAWAQIVRDGGLRIGFSLEMLRFLNIGGTAIGTGLNTRPGYAARVIGELNTLLDLNLQTAPDLVEATQDTSAFVELSGVFKMLAVRISKICNDLRLLSSGPRCGLGEINLPAMQPGSTIMPGKVNPVIPEVVNQVAFQVIGLDTTIALAAEGGQLELNVFEPVIAYNLFTSIRLLTSSIKTLRLRCVDGITANVEHCRNLVHNSIGIVTALNPHLGYDRTSEVAREALESGRSVYELVLEKGYMDQAKLDVILSPESMARNGG